MTQTKTNGEAHDVSTDGLTTEALLEVLLEAVTQLTERLEALTTTVDEVKEAQVELLEKVSNLSLPGADYGFDA